MISRLSNVVFQEHEVIEHRVESITDTCAPAAATIPKVAYSEYGNNPPAKGLLGSGYPYELLNEDDVSPPDKEKITPVDLGLSLDTCAGQAPVDTKVPLQSVALHEDMEPLVLPETPNVLNMGTRCMEQRYGFIWPPGKIPLFYPPGCFPKSVTNALMDDNSRRIPLEVEDNCPWIREGVRMVGAASAPSWDGGGGDTLPPERDVPNEPLDEQREEQLKAAQEVVIDLKSNDHEAKMREWVQNFAWRPSQR